MDHPQGINIDPELWRAVRQAAARRSVSISQFLIDAFAAEARRLERLAQHPELLSDDDKQPDLTHDELAEQAIRRALLDDRADETETGQSPPRRSDR
jgi:hypothetical protein